MEIQKCPPPLQQFGRWLLGSLHELTGTEPGLVAGWYRSTVRGKVCLYIYFIGNRGSGHRKNSAHLAAPWHDDFLKLDWVQKENNWFGKPSADCYLLAEETQSKGRAEVFIRQAFRSVAVNVYKETESAEADRKTFEVDTGILIDSNDMATQIVAAKRLRATVVKMGSAAGLFLRDVMVNVASDVVRKILMGT